MMYSSHRTCFLLMLTCSINCRIHCMGVFSSGFPGARRSSRRLGFRTASRRRVAAPRLRIAIARAQFRIQTPQLTTTFASALLDVSAPSRLPCLIAFTHLLLALIERSLPMVSADAKGPLLFMNQLSLKWLIQAPVFHRDLRRAYDMAEGRAATRKGRIDDDINLGYWMVRMPNLRVVRFRRVVWKDTWRDGADPALVLSAHKLPWSMHAEMYNSTLALWRSAAAAQVSAICRAAVPPCNSCSHARSQRACVVEVGLETTETSPACITRPKKGMGCPLFVRESHPEEYLHC